MHICYLTSEHPDFVENHGGIGTFVKWISESLPKEKNLKVSIVGVYDVEEAIIETRDDIDFYILPKSKKDLVDFIITHELLINISIKLIIQIT